MDPTVISQQCDVIDQAVATIRAELEAAPAPEPVPVLLAAGDDLQAALTTGGVYQLAPGADFAATGGFALPTPETRLQGLGANTVLGTRGPALRCGLAFHGGDLADLEIRVTEFDQTLIRLGINGLEQTEVAQVPRDFRLTRLTVPEYRGKHALELNAADVVVDHCDVRDVYAPSGQDSQAIWILNTPGAIHVRDCLLEAASENLMVGGDKVKLTDARPTNILIEDCVFTKPLAWKTAGTPRVKNLLELKEGWEVVVRRCTFSHSWKSAQDGYGFMFTPSQGGRVKVRVEHCVMTEVGGICNITGQDQNGGYPDAPRTQVHIVGGRYLTNTAAMGGPGRFALLTHGPERLIVEDADITIDGSAFILVGDRKPIDALHVLGCRWNYGSYGIMIGGYSHGDNQLGIIQDLRVEGCTIRGAHSAFKARFPDNTYVEAMSQKREREVDARVRETLAEVERELVRREAWAAEYQL